jgi:hypothetical protein
MRNFRGILLLTAAFILMFNGNIAIAKKSSEKAMFSKSNSNSKNGEMFSSKKTSSKKAYSKKSKNKSKNLAKKRRSKKPRKLTIGERLALVKKRYLAGIIKDKQMWQELTKIHSNGKGLSTRDKVSLLQMQSTLMLKQNFPISAAIYAAQAIKVSKNPSGRKTARAWTILKNVSEEHNIQNLLEIVAQKSNLKGSAPEFGTDWNYFLGNSYAATGKTDLAIKSYKKLKISDRYFLPGKYQQAMIDVDKNRLKNAIVSLKAVLYPTSHKMSPLTDLEKRKMADQALMALGRIYYEKEQFLSSAKMYRSVSDESTSFYDAMFEQSWAFFLGGYPSHALGALRAVESPFYAEVFNPEAAVLRALIHYWMCRYDDSRNALADFLDDNAKGVEELEGFLGRQRLTADSSFQLFEDLISGVSESSLGIDKKILMTASEKDSLLFVRDQYASVITERRRLEARGIFGTKRGVNKSIVYMERWESALRKDIGTKFLRELKSMKKDFDRLYSQAQFLYLELMMSEKDMLLGKNLHAASKITKVSKKQKIYGWGNKTQAWKSSEKNEYWWDEVGFYISPVQSQCTQ